MTRRLLPLLLLMLSLMFAGCGSESDVTEDDQDAFEKALFVSYAGVRDGQDMSQITIDDLKVVIDGIAADLVAYFQPPRNPADLAVGFVIELTDIHDVVQNPVSENVAGEIEITSTKPLTLAASLTFDGDFKVTGKSYKGTLDLTVVTNVADVNNVSTIENFGYTSYAFEKCQLTVSYANYSFSPVNYSGYSVKMENGPDQENYFLNGTITVRNPPVSYVFTSMRYDRISETELELDGIISIAGTEYDFEGDVTLSNVSSTRKAEWNKGTITIEEDDIVEVTIDGTSASFDDLHGLVWKPETSWRSLLDIP